jgi:hypothetical protein
MKQKTILVAALLALSRPDPANDPGDVVTQTLKLAMPSILGRPAIKVSYPPGVRHPHSQGVEPT